MRHPTTNVGGSTEVRTDGGEVDDSKDVVAGRYPHLTVNVAE